MESQPQNPGFRNNPENFQQCSCIRAVKVLARLPGVQVPRGLCPCDK